MKREQVAVALFVLSALLVIVVSTLTKGQAGTVPGQSDSWFTLRMRLAAGATPVCSHCSMPSPAESTT